MNFMTAARIAIWRELEQDPKLAADIAGATQYKFTSGELLKAIIDAESFIAPFVAMLPAKGDDSALTNISNEWHYRVALRFGAPGRDAEPTERFVSDLLDRVYQPQTSSYGLTDEGFMRLVVEDADWEDISTGKEIKGWVVETTLRLVFIKQRR